MTHYYYNNFLQKHLAHMQQVSVGGVSSKEVFNKIIKFPSDPFMIFHCSISNE